MGEVAEGAKDGLVSGSMSSIKRDGQKKAPPRPERKFLSRDPAHCGFTTLEKFGWLSMLMSFSAYGDDAVELRERHRERVVSFEEEARYLTAAREPLASVAVALVDTGMRPEECYRLRWEAITWMNGRNGSLLVTHGKTKAARRVLPMTPRVHLGVNRASSALHGPVHRPVSHKERQEPWAMRLPAPR